jgi:hypothetical protein
VAAFAAASSGYLFFIQILVALLASASIVWFLWAGWFPVINEAIRQLPTEGVIIDYALKAPIDPAEPLASSRLLGITGDPDDQGSTGITTDLLLQLRKHNVRFCSLLGCMDLPYFRIVNHPLGGLIENKTYILFSRPELEPKWEAWQPILLAIAAVGSFFALLASWTMMATVYFLPVWLFGFLKKRVLGFGGSWKLSGAALMPGAILLTAALVGYKWAVLDLISLFTLLVVHFVLGWVYLVMATLALPVKEKAAPGNPFTSEETAGSAALPTGATANPAPSLEGAQPIDPASPADTSPSFPASSEKSADENRP